MAIIVGIFCSTFKNYLNLLDVGGPATDVQAYRVKDSFMVRRNLFAIVPSILLRPGFLTRISVARIYGNIAVQRGFNPSAGLFEGNKYFVWIIQTKWRQIHGQTVTIWHSQPYLFDGADLL